MIRRNRLETLREVGIIAWLTLFHPALLNGTYDIMQQAVMDLIIPVAWCCFILLNYAITLVSIYLLIALWVIAAVAMFAFYYLNSPQHKQSPYQNIDSHAHISKKERGSANLEVDSIYRESCVERSSGTSPMNARDTGSAVVEMPSLNGVTLGDEDETDVFIHHPSSPTNADQEVAVATETDAFL